MSEVPEHEIHWASEEPWMPAERVAQIVQAALVHGSRPSAVLSVVFVDDASLSKMHADYLGDASPTDVISFDLGEDGMGPAGELYVSTDCARRLAQERGVDKERELALYVVHGTLHLCGWDDHEPEEREAMRAAEAEVMEALGFAHDRLPHDAE